MDAVTNPQAAPAPFVGLWRNYYGVILVDAAWNEVVWSLKGQGRSPSQKYPCMSVNEIAALPVGAIAARDCWLFKWTPAQHLANAIRVMEGWGFKFSSTAFVWVTLRKDQSGYVIGQGHTTRKGTEICLLERRGKPRRNSKSVRELIATPRREHSRKPDEQYQRIEEFCGGPYAELFAREQRPGWDAWGNETDHFNRQQP